MGAVAQTTQTAVIDQPPRVLAPTDIVMQVIQSGQSIDMVREVMALTKEIKAAQAREAFDAAIANAKAEIKPVKRNREGHNKKKYADFSAYAREVDPIISKFGLSYRFRTVQTEKITVTCIVSHRDGHFEENSLSGPADVTGNKNAIQAIGSTLTYLQRYTLTQALGLAAEDDDDGKAATPTIETITDDQVIFLRELIEAVGANEKRFLAHAGLERLEDIGANKYDDAVKLLKSKERNNG